MKPIQVCFRHERMFVNGEAYVQLVHGTVTRLGELRIHVIHEPCDLCAKDAQPRLFGRDES